MTGWKAKKDPLFRGDAQGGVQLPTPDADDSIVRHILYLGGYGRPTPYLSTTENREVAERFATGGGRVYETNVRRCLDHEARHISHSALLQNLKGKGKGKAAWPRALEVMRARQYVEDSAEHLIDFCGLVEDGLRERVDGIFPPRRT